MLVNQVQGALPARKRFLQRNIGAVTSESVDKKRYTAINHFNKFVKAHYDDDEPDYHNHPYQNFAEAVKDKRYMEDEDLLGAFGDFLSVGRSASQSGGCFSTFVAMLRNDHKMSIRDDFISRCRGIISKEFIQTCVKEGRDPENNARPMTRQDLEYYCEILFEQKSLAGMQARAALVLQWQTLGRVSEAFGLKLSDFSYCNEINNRALIVSFTLIN